MGSLKFKGTMTPWPPISAVDAMNSGAIAGVCMRLLIFAIICKFCRLSDAKQSRVYLPEAPFPHDGYVKSGRLKYFTTTHGEYFK